MLRYIFDKCTNLCHLRHLEVITTWLLLLMPTSDSGAGTRNVIHGVNKFYVFDVRWRLSTSENLGKYA